RAIRVQEATWKKRSAQAPRSHTRMRPDKRISSISQKRTRRWTHPLYYGMNLRAVTEVSHRGRSLRSNGIAAPQLVWFNRIDDPTEPFLSVSERTGGLETRSSMPKQPRMRRK